MSSQFYNQYLTLITDLKKHILQEYPANGSVVADSETFAYFKAQAKQKAPSQAQKTTPTEPLSPKKINPFAKPPIASPKGIETTPIAQSSEAPLPPEKEVVQSPAKSQNVLNKGFKRELLTPQPIDDFLEMRKVWTEKFPQIPLIDTLIDDKTAYLNSIPDILSTTPVVIVLGFPSTPKEKAFLSNLTTAINLCLVPAIIIDASVIPNLEYWQKILTSPQLKLVIACHHKLLANPQAMEFYREDQSTGKHSFGSSALLQLSDPALYMQEPKLKRVLWHNLCQLLKAR